MSDNVHSGVICANSDVLMREMVASGEKFDLVLTDPPYNLKKDFGNDSDCLSLSEFIEVTKRRVSLIRELLSDDGSVIWFGIHDYICYVQIAMYEAGLFYRRMNIWHYENGFSRSKKEPAAHYEPFLLFSKNPKKWVYNVDHVRVPYKSTERLKSAIKYRSANGETRVWKPDPRGSMRGDIWDFPTLAGKRFAKERTSHPTQKPVSLITELIKAFCPMRNGKYEGRILDPFLGSGTLGVCCEILNKNGHKVSWAGIELEQKWCDVALSRLVDVR